jgi:hypothetical protein
VTLDFHLPEINALKILLTAILTVKDTDLLELNVLNAILAMPPMLIRSVPN